MSSFSQDSAIPLRLAAAASRSQTASRLEEEIVGLFDELRAPLLRYLISLRLDVADAEEVVQEVFLALFRHLRSGKSRANLQGWIFRVAHNLALKSRTRTQRHQAALPDLRDDVSPGPEERMADMQRRERLLAVVRALPEQDQSCLSLRAEGLRYRDIASVLGMSLGSVANSLGRSLERLSRADHQGGQSATR